MDYLPLFFNLRDAPVVVVGGGSIALRKTRLLCRAGARVTVVAPEIENELEMLLQQNGGHWEQATYLEQHLGDSRLVVAATPLRQVNEAVAQHAKARGVPKPSGRSTSRSPRVSIAAIEFAYRAKVKQVLAVRLQATYTSKCGSATTRYSPAKATTCTATSQFA